MKNIIRITVFAMTFVVLSAMVLSAQDHNHSEKTDKKKDQKMHEHHMMDANNMDANNDGNLFQCSMHADQISDKQGDCSKCGMKLSEISVEDLNKEMNKNHDSTKKSSMVHKGTIDVVKIDLNNDGMVYQDMMDWNVISDDPGECPLCGMKLKEVTINEAVKNLEKHGFKTKN